MIPTCQKPYRDGDLRIGWASWDKDPITKRHLYKNRSVKYSYPGRNGNISRGAPEIPFDILLDMVAFAAAQGELDGDLQEVQEAYQELGAVLKRLGVVP